MKTLSFVLPVLAATLLAGCAHTPKESQPGEPFAEAIKELNDCMPPALYSNYAYSGQEPPEELAKMRLKDYAHSFLNVKMLRDYKSCLAANPAASASKSERAEYENWLAQDQKELDADEAGLPDGEKLADADEDYAAIDATHAKTTLTVRRRNGRKEVVEDSFEVPPQKP